MSHCRAAFRFADGVIMYSEYDGRIDRVCSPAYKTHEQVTETWRATKNPKCDCKKHDCEMFEGYGFGQYLPAKICFVHGSIEHGDTYEGTRLASDGSSWGHDALGIDLEEEE